MIALPPALAPWRAQLELFAPDLVAPLASLVQRIAPAIGPFQVHDVGNDGEVDGFAGITRRASFERLLMTEWALAEAIPDEFVRRAASNELSFLELARRRPAAARTSAVLFDTGPDTLGGPRIVQLALLIVLAHRAEAAGASFGWQLLESEPGVLRAGLTRDGVSAFLAGRSASTAGESEVRAWMDRLAKGPRLDELWIVGSPRTCADATSSSLSRVRLRDVLEPGTSRVSVGIAPAKRIEREIVLDLPVETECIRLLRNPLRRTTGPRAVTQTAPGSNLVFTSNERWIYARDPVSGVMRYPIPNSARAEPGRPRHYAMSTHAPIAAVGLLRSGALLLAFGGRNVWIESMSEKRGQRLKRSGVLPEDCHEDVATRALRPISVQWGTDADSSRIWWTQQDGSLLRFDTSPGGQIEHVARSTKVLVSLGSESRDVLYVARGLDASDDSPWWIRRSDGSPYGKEWDWPLAVEDVDRCFAASGFGASATLAIRDSSGRWTVLQGAVTRRYQPDGEVVGVSPHAEDPGLVVLDADAASLWAVGRSRSTCLAKSDERIVEATVSPFAQSVAYLTESGQLVVVQVATREIVARFVARGAPPK